MPRKIPTEHKHAPPGTQDLVPVSEDHSRHVCPNDERIAALERQFEQIAKRNEQLPTVVDGEHNEQRFRAMASQISNLREQIVAVQELPRLSPDDVNSLSTALNTRVKGMIEEAITKEVTQIKIRVASMERASAPSLARDVEQLGKIVSETGRLVASLDERGAGLEAELDAARSEINMMHSQFNKQMADSLRAVVDTFQGVPA